MRIHPAVEARRAGRPLSALAAGLMLTTGAAFAQSAPSQGTTCPLGYTCAASGVDTTALQPIVDSVVGTMVAKNAVHNAIVGVSWHGQRAYFGYGASGLQPYSFDTIVEIGSITKVFTTALFEEAIQDGRVRLDDPLRTYAGGLKLTALNWCAAEVTLQQLADFRSSMPELPAERDGTPLGSIPLAQRVITDYTPADFLYWVSQWKPGAIRRGSCDLPASYNYSNASVGLLGYIIADRYATGWPALVQGRITGPLGMTSTRIVVPPADRGRVAQGYDGKTTAIPWPIFAWYPAGALRSDAADMLSFGEAALGHTSINGSATPPALIAALQQAMTTVYPVTNPQGTVIFNQGLAWVQTLPVSAKGFVPLYLKDGGTDGFSSVVVINPSKDMAVFLSFNEGYTPVQSIGESLTREIR